jgi:hypothetical protein
LNLEFLSDQLSIYEEEAQKAVEGNLMLTNTTSKELNGTDHAFPIQSEKWTLMQAIFFASTICTTIGYGNVFKIEIFEITE